MLYINTHLHKACIFYTNNINITCIVPETTPVQMSQVLVVETLQCHFLLLQEAENRK